jgi:hypothetical protein
MSPSSLGDAELQLVALVVDPFLPEIVRRWPDPEIAIVAGASDGPFLSRMRAVGGEVGVARSFRK